MYSVIEANLAVICANLPALGYKLVFRWKHRDDQRRSVTGSTARDLILAASPKVTNIPKKDQEVRLDPRALELQETYNLGRSDIPLAAHSHYLSGRRVSAP